MLQCFPVPEKLFFIWEIVGILAVPHAALAQLGVPAGPVIFPEDKVWIDFKLLNYY